MATKNWTVGEMHGDFELIAINPKTATFRGSDGKEIEYPNIFQDKATRGIIEPEKKAKKIDIDKVDDVDALDEIIAKAKAKLTGLKA